MLPIFLILAYAPIAIFDFVPLYKQKLWKELIVNAFIGLMAFSTLLMLSLKIDIPSPAEPIKNFITSIFGK